MVDTPRDDAAAMSYTITLQCGCDVYVACNPWTGLAHTRVIERRALRCPVRSHATGTHLQPSDLPSAEVRQPVLGTDFERLRYDAGGDR